MTPDLLQNVVSKRTRWLILNSPCNPTGSLYSRAELSALADVIRNYPDLGIISDDIYEKIVFDQHEFFTMAQVAPDLSSRIITINGVSKAYAMTGWRIGYAGGPKDLIDAMIKLQGQSTTNASSVSQAAALAALKGDQSFLQNWNSDYQNRRDLVAENLKFQDQANSFLPEGAFYHFISCDTFIGMNDIRGEPLETDYQVCEYLLNDFGVSVVPGSEFGCSGYFRLCFAKNEYDLLEACKRINKAQSALSR